MARHRDEVDRLLEAWGSRRREVLGLRHPLRACDYLGATRCTLSQRRDLHAGSRSKGRVNQAWPEFPFTGQVYGINQLIKTAPERLRVIYDVHWTVQSPRDKRIRAAMLGISARHYWRLVGKARDRVAKIFSGEVTL